MQNAKKGLIIFSIMFVVSLIGVVIATGGAKLSQPNTALSQELSCRLNFNLGVLNSTLAIFPNSSSVVQPLIASMQSDLSQVQTMNNTEIRSFVKTQYAPEVKSAISAVQVWRKSMKVPLSLDERAAIISNYTSLKNSYSQCEQNVYLSIGNDRVSQYKTQITGFQNQTDSLSQRGFNVTSLNNLIQEAQSQVVTPLESAVSAANSSSNMRDAVQSYCLYNGCANGTNFHMESRFQLTRISIVFADLQKNAAVFNLSGSLVSQDENAISSAQSTLNTVGTSMYKGNQSDEVWSNIKLSYNLTKQLVHQAMSVPLGAK